MNLRTGHVELIAAGLKAVEGLAFLDSRNSVVIGENSRSGRWFLIELSLATGRKLRTYGPFLGHPAFALCDGRSAVVATARHFSGFTQLVLRGISLEM